MKINIIVDNLDSWILPYAKKLVKILSKKNTVRLYSKDKDIKPGYIALYLGCENIIKQKTLGLNKHNLIVHESKLPKGKGWSPLTWQILEGKNIIPITLFEADSKVDSGNIYFQEKILFRGDELLSELKHQQGEKTIDLVLKFIKNYPDISEKKQRGESTHYAKRTPKDSELNINKSIKSQFNLLRVVDNKRYPAFFKYKNNKYILKIYKDDEQKK